MKSGSSPWHTDLADTFSKECKGRLLTLQSSIGELGLFRFNPIDVSTSKSHCSILRVLWEVFRHKAIRQLYA